MRHHRIQRTLKRKICTGGVCLLALHLIGCAGVVRKPLSLRAVYSPSPQVLIGPAVTIDAAGDIACDPNDRHFNEGKGIENKCQMLATSDLILRTQPAAVLALGDTQYERGRLDAFFRSYDPTWGRFKDITRPAVGNHEYGTAGAAGYFTYFGARAGLSRKGYYSFEIGSWHLIALNSNCAHVGGCGFGSPQERWLQTDLRNHANQCVLAYWHHARFSSGLHGSNRAYLPFWKDLYQAGADLVLAGHDHDYEAFAPQDPGVTSTRDAGFENWSSERVARAISGSGGSSRSGATGIQTVNSKTPTRSACFAWNSIAMASHGVLSRSAGPSVIWAPVYVIRLFDDRYHAAAHHTERLSNL